MKNFWGSNYKVDWIKDNLMSIYIFILTAVVIFLLIHFVLNPQDVYLMENPKVHFKVIE